MKVVLDEGAKLPVKAHNTDAGYDLFAKEDFDVPGCTSDGFDGARVGAISHDTGVHIEIPAGYAGFIKSKSGLNVKKGITAEGVIDCGYTGSIVVKFYNHTRNSYHFNKGDKITQLVILPVYDDILEVVDSLEATDRGDGGFGSTGK